MNNLIEIQNLVNAKLFHQALVLLEKKLNDSPNSKDVLNLAGVCHVNTGNLKAGYESFSLAVKYNPLCFQSVMNLALCLVSLNNLDDAKKYLYTALSIRAEDPNALNSLGNIYRIQGSLEQASIYLKKAKAYAPSNPAIHENLAWLALKKGSYGEAKHKFLTLSHSFPKKKSLYLGVAECFYHQGYLIQATQALKQALQCDENFAEAHLLLSIIFKKQQLFREQFQHLSRALNLQPKVAETHFQLALYYQEIAEEPLSIKHFCEAVSIQPTYFEAYFHLASKKAFNFDLSMITKIENLMTSHALDENIHWLHFALANHYEKQKCYEKAAIQLTLARNKRERSVTTSSHNDRPFEQLKQIRNASSAPKDIHQQFIFVTGMPRSGTTLLDQILDCHSEVTSIGESGLVSALAAKVEQLTKQPYYQGINTLSAEDKYSIIEQELIRRNLPKSTAILDTSPSNIFYVSFIVSLFPQCKIILLRRSPLDTCLSIYKLPLDNHDYANQLKTLGNYFIEVNKLINHWLEVFSNQCCEYRYEQLVGEPSKNITKLLSHLSLSYEDACLRPECNSRHVRTPSSEQVRSPINQNAIGKWRKFEPYISELVETLQNLEQEYFNGKL